MRDTQKRRLESGSDRIYAEWTKCLLDVIREYSTPGQLRERDLQGRSNSVPHSLHGGLVIRVNLKIGSGQRWGVFHLKTLESGSVKDHTDEPLAPSQGRGEGEKGRGKGEEGREACRVGSEF